MDIGSIRELFYVRIQSIEFKDFRNIEHGKIVFPDSTISDFLEGKSSVLGLYGQNGSGKTSVIMALGLLKSVLSGRSLDNHFLSCIRIGCERCTLKLSFAFYSKLTDDDGRAVLKKEYDQCYLVNYDFDVALIQNESDDIDKQNFSQEDSQRLVVENEVIKIKSIRPDGTVLMHKQVFFDTSLAACDNGRRAFGGKAKYDFYTKENPETQRKYADLKAVAYANSRSFLFSKGFSELFEKRLKELIDHFDNVDDAMIENLEKVTEMIASGEDPTEFVKDDINSGNKIWNYIVAVRQIVIVPWNILKNLRTFGSAYLHVLDTSTMGQTSMNVQLPLMVWYNHKEGGVNSGVYSFLVNLNMDGPSEIEMSRFPFMIIALQGVSKVLSKMVPGLSLGYRNLGKSLNVANVKMQCFEIVSQRNENVIPLKYESDGVRRIVSIMSLLIAAYNDESFTIAIDEFDAGLYEYLLGELISVLSESKGQLVFSSHNLRPLEVLPAKYLCFTTTDPNNRFVTLSRRGNSNLRDCYFRSIVLGNDKACLYNPTDRYEIEMALRESGEHTK